MPKHILKSRTFWLNLAVALLLGLAGIDIGDKSSVVAVVAAANIVLRIATREKVTV